MAREQTGELIDAFKDIYDEYYREEIGELVQNYPAEQKSLYLDWQDIYQFDPDLADDVQAHPEELREYAEEALRLYDLPVDVKLGQAHIRVCNLSESTGIREISATHRGQLISMKGIVKETTDVQTTITYAAFECQRCGTLTRIPQTNHDLQEPHECQGCERQGPFRINYDQSEFIDAQTIRLLEDPVDLTNGSVPQEVKVRVEDDLAGHAVAGDKARVTGVCKLEQVTDRKDAKDEFEVYLRGHAIKPSESDLSGVYRSSSPSVTDLETYVDAIGTALSTLPENPREEETKAKLITPLLKALGWNKYDSNEVRLEYTDSKTNLRPDYALFGSDSETPDVVIEAKQLSTDLATKEEQLQNYLRVFAAEWGILTNGREFHIFRCSGKNGLPEKHAEIPISDLSEAGIMESLHSREFT